MIMSKYLSRSHVTYNMGYHIVFCPKYRYSLLRYRTEDELKKLLEFKAESLGITIRTMEVMPDHVHLFIAGLPDIPVDNIIRQLKGYTSFSLRKQFAYLRKYPTLWTRSYFVETVGHISESTVAKYIESQKSKALSSPGLSREDSRA